MLHTLNAISLWPNCFPWCECDLSVFDTVMCCLSAGVIQGNVMKIKRGSMTHSINLRLITSDPIVSDTDINTPMHG